MYIFHFELSMGLWGKNEEKRKKKGREGKGKREKRRGKGKGKREGERGTLKLTYLT